MAFITCPTRKLIDPCFPERYCATASACWAITVSTIFSSSELLEIWTSPFSLTIAPGEILGWHYHPGVGAYTIVAQGTLVVEDGCGGETVYTQGDAFLEPPNRVHRGKNLTTGQVVTAQTFLVPAGTGISASVPQLCGAPVAVEECANHGWMSFNHPRTFASQGDCLQFVITGK